MPGHRGLARPSLSASLACRARLEPPFPCQDLTHTLPPASHLDKFREMRQALPARDQNILTTWRVQLPQLSLRACSIWNKGFKAYETCTGSHFRLSSAPFQNGIQAQRDIIQSKGCVAVCMWPLQRDFSVPESSFASWSARLSLTGSRTLHQSNTGFAN